MVTARVGLAVLLAALTARSAAAAASCGSADRPWVSVAFSTPVTAPFAERVLLDFRAGLEAESIDVCAESAGPSHAPVAAVRLAIRDRESVRVSVDVRDRVTSKRVGRDLDLSNVPADGRAFAVAVAADELVRASWAELALARSREDAPAPPPEVTAVVERARPSSSARVGARTAAEHFTGGQTHWGGDAYVRAALARRLRLELSAGLRDARAVEAPHGRVRATALGSGAALDALVYRATRLEVGLGVGARAAWIRFEGDPAPDGVARDWTGVAVELRANAGVSARLAGPLWLELGGGGGAPIRALTVEDAGRVVTGTSGLELSFHAGVAAEF